MVVHRPQVRQLAQPLRDLDLVQDAVEGHALVHQHERLGFDRVEQVGGVGERLADTIGAEDRQAVSVDVGEQLAGSGAPVVVGVVGAGL